MRTAALSLALPVLVLSWLALPALQGNPAPGAQIFSMRCARCHGADGTGGDTGPSIVLRIRTHTDAELADLIRRGVPGTAMPATPVLERDMENLVAFLRSIQRTPEQAANLRALPMDGGRTITGTVLGEGFDDLQVRTGDGRVHLLRRDEPRAPVREVTSTDDWPTYNGDTRGNRYTPLTDINRDSVTRLAPRWTFTMPAGGLQGTPVVVKGIMYVTAPNECLALDAGSGREIWHYKRPRTAGVSGGGANRGASVAGDRVFMETDNAHVLALDRQTGALLWERELADWQQNYAGSSAPLPAGTFVIAGVAGGEHGANGFVSALDQATGREVWRFWTVPKPGTPGSDTWPASPVDHGGAPTWFTGSYDPTLDLVYWPVGNPSAEYNGDDRAGDDLYSDSILALNRRTGALVWHYQFTPHDLWDWDATEPFLVVDGTWLGQPRPLLLHADRNGFFYVFDRRDGTRLLTTRFVRNLTWASGIGADGRPVVLPDQAPTPAGTKVCPSQDGATNWFAPSFDPKSGLFYLQTFEKCSIYRKADPGPWMAGKSYLGGDQRVAPDPVPARVLKAIDTRTGEIRWEVPQPGAADSWGGTLTTAGGVVLFAAEGGLFMAADAATGHVLWRFDTNASMHASPMTYTFDGTEYVALEAGSNVLAFTLR